MLETPFPKHTNVQNLWLGCRSRAGFNPQRFDSCLVSSRNRMSELREVLVSLPCGLGPLGLKGYFLKENNNSTQLILQLNPKVREAI